LINPEALDGERQSEYRGRDEIVCSGGVLERSEIIGVMFWSDEAAPFLYILISLFWIVICLALQGAFGGSLGHLFGP